MILNDDDRPLRVRPRKPPVARREGAAWVGSYRLLMHYARSGRKFIRNAGGRAIGAERPHNQRCAVRVTYLNNRTRGHGKPMGAIWHERVQLTPRLVGLGSTVSWMASMLSANSNAGSHQKTRGCGSSSYPPSSVTGLICSGSRAIWLDKWRTISEQN